MSPALAAVFGGLFAFVGLVFPQPRATSPAAVSVLNRASFADVAAGLDVSVAATSQQLPTVIAFAQGKELARLPTVSGETGKLEGLKLTYASLVEGLGLDERLRVAEAWEAEARDKLAAAQAREAKKRQ